MATSGERFMKIATTKSLTFRVRSPIEFSVALVRQEKAMNIGFLGAPPLLHCPGTKAPLSLSLSPGFQTNGNQIFRIPSVVHEVKKAFLAFNGSITCRGGKQEPSERKERRKFGSLDHFLQS